jgi:DNA-binding transcriptional ArsR family regulator
MTVCASQLEYSGLSQSTVSVHPGTLQCADLVTTRSIGQRIFYKRNEETIVAFLGGPNGIHDAALTFSSQETNSAVHTSRQLRGSKKGSI